LNVRPVYVILVKENVIQLPHIDHFAALLALLEMAFSDSSNSLKSAGFNVGTVRAIVFSRKDV